MCIRDRAYDAVKNITGWAKAIKIPIIFKKTDSALRGNIGSELQAVLDGKMCIRDRYIPKGNGKKRPLGIASYEDKIVQMAVKKILGAIYEPRSVSYTHLAR